MCDDLKFLRCLIRSSLRHEKHRSFLFSRLDLLNRTNPGEVVRNVEYMLYSAIFFSSRSEVCLLTIKKKISGTLLQRRACKSYSAVGRKTDNSQTLRVPHGSSLVATTAGSLAAEAELPTDDYRQPAGITDEKRFFYFLMVGDLFFRKNGFDPKKGDF
jgi:hypothetical protein